MNMVSVVAGSVFLGLVAVAGAQHEESAISSPLETGWGKIPLAFVENRGVHAKEVCYFVQGADRTLFFTRNGVTIRLTGRKRSWVVRLEFVGARPDVNPRGEDRQPALVNYFKGPREAWTTGLRTYAAIVYRDLWPGIDLVYRGTVNRLKYEFVLAAGADPAMIRLRYRGASSWSLAEDGSLRVETPEGSLEDAPPVAWQDSGGQRVPVHAAYAPGEGQQFGFEVGEYDRTRPLVLDPAVLVYCGFLGGAYEDRALDIALDAAGNAYVTGITNSTEQTFPVVVGPDLTHNSGTYDVFVAKVNPQGTGLIYCGYIGGNGAWDYASGIAVDAAGNAYVTGYTNSTEKTFPVVTGPDLTHNGSQDAFVAKVNPQGTGLVYCGYIGGSGGSDLAGSVAVDTAGNAYVVGYTDSTEQTFPVVVGPDLTHNGAIDVFVAKVNPQGTGFAYCGYIGGVGVDYGGRVAVNAAGEAYVTGYTSSSEQTFPVAVGPDLTHNGAYDAFVTKVNAQGTGLVYCGYIGGTNQDYGNGVAVDAAGNAYVVGTTSSTQQTFPVAVGPDLTHNGAHDVFVARVDPAGTGLAYCGYLGGSGFDYGGSIAVDTSGGAYVVGRTNSTEQTFPVGHGPDLTHNGGNDAFVAKVNARGTGLTYCGYIGGAGEESSGGIALDAAGSPFVAGNTDSTEQTFPVAVGPDLTQNGVQDAFVARIAETFLIGTGTPNPGGQVFLSLVSPSDGLVPYQLASSFGTGPMSFGSRKIDLSPDSLLFATVSGWWPSIFSGYAGVLDSRGRAQASVFTPNHPALIGQRIHTAFVTLDGLAAYGIRSVSNTETFTITR